MSQVLNVFLRMGFCLDFSGVFAKVRGGLKKYSKKVKIGVDLGGLILLISFPCATHRTERDKLRLEPGKRGGWSARDTPGAGGTGCMFFENETA